MKRYSNVLENTQLSEIDNEFIIESFVLHQTRYHLEMNEYERFAKRISEIKNIINNKNEITSNIKTRRLDDSFFLRSRLNYLYFHNRITDGYGKDISSIIIEENENYSIIQYYKIEYFINQLGERDFKIDLEIRKLLFDLGVVTKYPSCDQNDKEKIINKIEKLISENIEEFSAIVWHLIITNDENFIEYHTVLFDDNIKLKFTRIGSKEFLTQVSNKKLENYIINQYNKSAFFVIREYLIEAMGLLKNNSSNIRDFLYKLVDNKEFHSIALVKALCNEKDVKILTKICARLPMYKYSNYSYGLTDTKYRTSLLDIIEYNKNYPNREEALIKKLRESSWKDCPIIRVLGRMKSKKAFPQLIELVEYYENEHTENRRAITCLFPTLFAIMDYDNEQNIPIIINAIRGNRNSSIKEIMNYLIKQYNKSSNEEIKGDIVTFFLEANKQFILTEHYTNFLINLDRLEPQRMNNMIWQKECPFSIIPNLITGLINKEKGDIVLDYFLTFLSDYKNHPKFKYRMRNTKKDISHYINEAITIILEYLAKLPNYHQYIIDYISNNISKNNNKDFTKLIEFLVESVNTIEDLSTIIKIKPVLLSEIFTDSNLDNEVKKKAEIFLERITTKFYNTKDNKET